MRNIFILLCSFFLIQLSTAQTAGDHFRTGDSLFNAQDYKNAAAAFSAGINLKPDAPIFRYRFATASWALTGNPDSAFQLLGIIAKSDKLSKFDAYQLEHGTDFTALRKDPRWRNTLEKIRKQSEKNAYPQEEFIYGRKDGIGLTLVRILPKVKTNGKAIIYTVSGGWNSSYNGVEMPVSAVEQYLARGYTVFAVMHGSQPRYAIPDAFSDMKRAVRYIRYHAPKFAIDPDRIGITGGSAGGHLSLLVATAADSIDHAAADPVDRVSSRVQAVAVLYPPTDFLNWGGPGLNMVNAKEILKQRRSWGAVNFTDWNEKYRLYEEVSDTAMRNKIGKEVSPLYFVSQDDPPVFIIHGDADPTVPLQQSHSIIARYKEAGVIHQFIIKKGGKHNPDDMNPEWLQFADWFDKYLK